MALFYLIAKKETDFDWSEIHEQVFSFEHKYLTIFPIPHELNLLTKGIGITASGKFAKEAKQAKDELKHFLDVLWQNEFIICDLYKGEVVTSGLFAEVLNYF